MALSYNCTFLGWNRPALQRAAQLLVEYGTGAEDVDLGDQVVVVPGARAGRRLNELLLEEAERQDLALVPPRIVTTGALPELFYQERASPPAFVRRRAWAAALASLPPGQFHILMTRPPGAGDLPAWFSLAAALDGLHVELGGELLDFQAVAEACGGDLSFDDAPRWEVLARVQEEAMRILEQGGWEDPVRARARVLRSDELVPPERLWLVAVSEMPGVVREFVALVPGSVEVLVNAPEDQADAFDPDGVLRVEAWETWTLQLDGIPLNVAGGPGDQADLAVRELAVASSGRTPEDMVVGVADPEVRPYLLQRLGAEGIPARMAAGTPFRNVGPHRLLLAVSEHLRAGSADTFARLVRHPDFWDSLEADARALRDLDRFRERALPARLDHTRLEGGRPGRREWETVEALRRRVEEGIGRFRASRMSAKWVPEVSDFLQAVYGARVLREDRAEDRVLLEYLPRMSVVLESVLADQAEPGDAVPGWAMLRIIADLLSSEAVPPTAEAHAVEILDWLELPLDDAPVLVLTGVNHPHLPTAIVGDPFLPDALRSRLGIQDNRRRRARDTYLLQASVAPRERATLVGGRRGGSGDPLRPSPLLLTGDPAQVAARVLDFLGDEDDGSAVRPPPEEGPAPSIPPEPNLSIPPGPLRISVSSFRTLLGSPYLWALQNVLKLGTVDDNAREMGPLAFGTLLHRTLEVLGTDLREETHPDRLARGLVARLRDASRAEFGSRPLPSVRVQLKQMEARLGALAEVEAESRAAGWEIMAVEAGLPREGVAVSVDGREFLLTGTVDRVDRHPSGLWRILDYKTGERAENPERAHRRSGGGSGESRWVDLQLPLYQAFHTQIVGPQGVPLIPADSGPIEVGYFTVPRALDEVEIRMAGWDADDLADALDAARDALRSLTGEGVSFDPNQPLPSADDPLAPVLGVGILVPPLEELEDV